MFITLAVPTKYVSLGSIGAAVATIVAQFVSGFMVPVFFRIDRKYPMIVFKSLLYGVKI